ncbi:BTAD domain-containing putative transcriptional regulator [Phytoactinopolyspora halotolerans]|uniref:AfsR/SARP family transcriptional regulator n=1 Tax=Phytoactinopolyspora halotolerans TaxID=1981512 RepID=A0A6L9SCR9_9ACTN|nr:BTAD domain-containing putative transcriptional regulator [Phytoactinopolyspora halotolerans]NEE02484.1 AfsR/SARP family transcriptional regulator [Phytoactinopolyspora halotolerans]
MQIGMLGPFEVRTDDGALADVPGARLRALLIALALQPGRSVGKSMLVDWIWGENPPADAANALQRLVSRLRKALPAGVIDGQAGGYRLTVEPDDVDACAFERLVALSRQAEGPSRIQLLRDAMALWRGAAMQDVGLEGSEAFDAAATRLEGLRLTTMEDRFDAEVGLGHGAEVITELTDAVAAYPLRERLAAALMRALVAAGRSSEALLAYERTKEALADTLGVDPSPELSALHLALLRGEVGEREQGRKTNVRAELTSFIGRDGDVAAVRGLIAKHRLTTLIGPGGAGKTRLATETARTLSGDLPDGVWMVEFAPIDAAGDTGGGPEGQGGGKKVAQTALAGLGLRDALLGATPSADPVDGLVAALRDREMLLILDNCEHVIDSVAALAEQVLGECRRLRILATSREPLGITGEALWQVEPLAVETDGAGLEEIAASPAVRLLRDRADALRKDLGFDEHTTALMVRICRALDGMPLAIELAAARLRTMTIEQLANRLDDRFRLLTSGSRTALPRHKTLRAVVDWSWELLTDAERMVLRRLSVFSGGASLDAAERVCAGPYLEHQPGQAVTHDQVLELLTSLVEKSLVIAEGDDTPRYRMLTTIKEYAAERLAEAGEAAQARQAHLAYFTELAETAEPHLRRAEQLQWLATLEADHHNISAALRGVIADGDAQAATRLAAATGWYWWLGGRRAEGLELLIAAADLPGEATDDVRAVAYGMVVLFVTSGQGDERLGAEWIHKAHRFSRRSHSTNPLLEFAQPLERLLQAPEEAVSAFESLLESADPWVRAMGRWQAAKMRTMFGQGGREVEAQLEQALAEFRALGERFGMYVALSTLATQLAQRGEYAGACDYYEQAITVLTELGAVEDVIEVRTQQAPLYWLNGDHDASAAALAEAERCAEGVTWPYALASLALAKAGIARRRGDAGAARHELGVATTLLGDVAEQPNVRAQVHDLLGYLADDLRESRTHRVAAWQAASETGAPPIIANTLIGIADLAIRLDEYEQAARLLGASVVVRGSPDRSHPDAARIEQDARRHLGETRFAEVTREGTQQDWSELVEATLAS